MAKTTPSSKRVAKDVKDKATPVPKKSKKKSSPPKQLSTEVILDSDEEADSPQEISDDDSLHENPVASKAKVNGKIPSSEGSESPSENESGSDAESDEDEEDEEEEQPPPVEKAPKPRVQFAKEPTPPPAAPKPVAAYKPPTGFEPLSIGEGASQVAKPFKSSKLTGKQLWYFTAPASIPVSSIQQMSLLGAKNGDVVYSKDGNDYGFSTTEKEENTYTSILVPSSSENGYTIVPKSVDQVLHLGPIAKQPGANATSSKATVPAPKPVRQQPKGLKMRFFPIGFGQEETAKLGSASDDSSSEGETQAPTQFRQPESVASDSDIEMSEAPPVQSKPKSHKSSKSESKSGSLKRKHGEGSEKKKSKHSSSLSTDSPNNQQLKRLKTKQTDYPRSLADKPSASINAPVSTTPILPPKSRILKSSMKLSLKPSSDNIPSRSVSTTSPSKVSLPDLEEIQQENVIPKKSKLKRKDKKIQDEAPTPVKKSKSKNKDKHKDREERSQSTDSGAESGKKVKKSIFSQSTNRNRLKGSLHSKAFM